MLIKKISILMSLFLILLLINFGVERTVYSNEKWNDYYKTNSLRHKIQLRGPERMLEDKYMAVGWSKLDLELFNRFILVDKNQMNEDSMSTILEITKENNLNKLINFLNLYSKLFIKMESLMVDFDHFKIENVKNIQLIVQFKYNLCLSYKKAKVINKNN